MNFFKKFIWRCRCFFVAGSNYFLREIFKKDPRFLIFVEDGNWNVYWLVDGEPWPVGDFERFYRLFMFQFILFNFLYICKKRKLWFCLENTFFYSCLVFGLFCRYSLVIVIKVLSYMFVKLVRFLVYSFRFFMVRKNIFLCIVVSLFSFLFLVLRFIFRSIFMSLVFLFKMFLKLFCIFLSFMVLDFFIETSVYWWIFIGKSSMVILFLIVGWVLAIFVFLFVCWYIIRWK